jgi:hypothetical protein
VKVSSSNPAVVGVDYSHVIRLNQLLSVSSTHSLAYGIANPSIFQS